MKDLPVRIDPEEAAIGRPTATARRLVEASVSPNTRRAYAGALRRVDAWLDGRELHDVTLAAYRAAWSRPPSARTRGGPTLARSGGWTPGSTGASSTM